MKRIYLFLAIFCFSIAVKAKKYTGEQADQLIKGTEMIWIKEHMNVPTYIRFNATTNIQYANIQEWMRANLNLAPEVAFRLLSEDTDQMGFVHYKLQQLYRDRDLEFARYTVHTKNGRVVSLSGDIHKTANPASGQFIAEDAALKSALDHINASVYKWQIKGEEEHLKLSLGDPNATFTPKGEIMVVPKNGDLRKLEFRYAYKFDIYAHEPESRRDIYIDALNGEVVFQNSRIKTADTNGTAVTAFSDTVTITTDTYQSTHRLFESGRGRGIHTWNLETRTRTNTAVEFTDPDNFWNNFNPQLDQYATDAHWGAELTYDYLLTQFNRNSIDNAGFRLNSYVHYDNQWSNASWNGFNMRYGDGNGNSKPFTTVDVSGHEIAHGLTDYTADLIYLNEMGALNESFSDIFGTCIEFFGKPNSANWLVGEDRGNPLRNMENPKAFGDPDTYSGQNWVRSQVDNGGVHTNSGVQNYWFYLLTEGGMGTNDNDSTYDVTGIGISDAADIAYRNLSVYLGRFSEYEDAQFFAVQSAIDLFGNCSQQHESTVNAWFAAGVGRRYFDGAKSDFGVETDVSCQLPFMANFINLSQNGTSYTWDFGDNMTANTETPSHLYTEEGEYTVSLTVDGGACGRDSVVKTAFINIEANNAPEFDEDSLVICPGEIALFSSTNQNQTLRWYESETGGAAIYTGSEYQAGPLNESKDYYIENVVVFPEQNLGPQDNSLGSGRFSNASEQLIFDVFTPLDLVAITVYVLNDKERTIELMDENDNLLDSRTIFIPDGEQRVEVNFHLEPGAEYKIGFSPNSAPAAFINEENATFPYTKPGVLSITGNSASSQGFYFFFYDWEIKLKDCVSPRAKVKAIVDCNAKPGGASNEPSLELFPNPASSNLFINAFFTDDDYVKVRLVNASGQVVRDFEQSYSEGGNTIRLDIEGVAPGLYYVTAESTTVKITEKLIISNK